MTKISCPWAPLALLFSLACDASADRSQVPDPQQTQAPSQLVVASGRAPELTDNLDRTRGLVAQPRPGMGEGRLGETTCQAHLPESATSAAPVVGFAMCVRGRDGGLYRLRDGGTLISGERVSMSVRVARDSYIRVVQVQSGVATRLWPRAHHDLRRPIPARNNLELPGPLAGYDFVVDDRTGPFSIFVVASTQVLADADPVLATLIDDPQTQGRRKLSNADLGSRTRVSVHESVSEPKPGVGAKTVLQDDFGPTLGERGEIHEHQDAATVGVSATPDGSGVAILEFRVLHKQA